MRLSKRNWDLSGMVRSAPAKPRSSAMSALIRSIRGRRLSNQFRSSASCRVPTVSRHIAGRYAPLRRTRYRWDPIVASVPVSTFVMERLIDMAAGRLEIDPVELRLRNLVEAEDFPYRTPSGIVWDRSAFVETLTSARDTIDYHELRA